MGDTEREIERGLETQGRGSGDAARKVLPR
jgi:hypothetical protein